MRRLRITLAILVLLGIAYYWLLGESHVPGGGRFTIDLSTVRQLANSIPGEKPREVRVERVTEFSAPATVIMAGDSLGLRPLPVHSYQVVYSDHTVIIDTAMDESLSKASHTSVFDSAAYSRMSKAISAASMILITHEHVDHLGGLTVQPDLARLITTGAVRLTREQVDHPERMLPAAFPAGALSAYKPIVYERAFAIAPGIVLIKSPGHTPGSQMIFVQKQDGTEILFLGDVAWQMQNVDNVRERARFVTLWITKEDRDAVLWELAELHRIHQIYPALRMIPGHDGEAVSAAVSANVMTRGFQ